MLIAIFILVALCVSIICLIASKCLLRRGKDFCGLFWGMIMGLFTGVIWCVAFYSEISLELLKHRYAHGWYDHRINYEKKDLRHSMAIALIIHYVIIALLDILIISSIH